jgi:hypothetical protein
MGEGGVGLSLFEAEGEKIPGVLWQKKSVSIRVHPWLEFFAFAASALKR